MGFDLLAALEQAWLAVVHFLDAYLEDLPTKVVDYIIFGAILTWLLSFRAQGERYREARTLLSLHRDHLLPQLQSIPDAKAADDTTFRKAKDGLEPIAAQLNERQLGLIPFIGADEKRKLLRGYVDRADQLASRVDINITQDRTSDIRRLFGDQYLGQFYRPGRNPVSEMTEDLRTVLRSCGYSFPWHWGDWIALRAARKIDKDMWSLKREVDATTQALGGSFDPITPELTQPS